MKIQVSQSSLVYIFVQFASVVCWSLNCFNQKKVIFPNKHLLFFSRSASTTSSTLGARQWGGLLGRIENLICFHATIIIVIVITMLMIRAAVNVHLTPCTLELGGKSPTYFDDSGDMEVRTIIFIIASPDQSEKTSLGKVQQLRPNLCCSGLHPLLKSRRTLIWSRSELEISILAKGGRFKTMPFCCLCWCVLSRRQRRNWSLWWKKSCDSSTERSQRIQRTIAESVSWHRQCFLIIASTPAVSSRHLDRLKGLLAKSEGTVALGGRSDDQTRFSLLLFPNGGWRW